MENNSRHDATSIFAYLAVVRRRAWVIAICAITVPAVAYFLSSRQTPQYTSTADVYINQQNVRLMGDFENWKDYYWSGTNHI